MNFNTATQYFLHFFYFIGLNNFEIERNEHKVNFLKKIIKIFITIAIPTIMIITFSLQYIDFFNQNTQIFTTGSAGLYLLLDEFVTTVIFIRSIVVSENVMKIFNKIYKINLMLERCCSSKINFNILRNKLFKLFIIVYATILITICVFFSINSKVHPKIFNYAIMMLLFSKGLILIHMIFFIEVINFHFKCINTFLGIKVKRVNLTFRRSSEQFGKYYLNRNLIESCFLLKIMHFEVWNLSMNVNKHFEWSSFLCYIICDVYCCGEFQRTHFSYA